MAEPGRASKAGDTDPVEEIERLALALPARARAEGEAGLPAPGSAEISAAEREVLETLIRQRATAEAQRSAIAASVEQELRAAAGAVIDPAGPCAAARVELRTSAGRFAPDIARARQRAERAEHDLERFRRTHELGRAAIYPDSRILQAGLLLIAAAFEALFSAALFAETDERGLLGGAVTALGLSGANVALGFLSGFLGLRYIGHRQPGPRIAGGAALVVLATLSLSLNLFAAHWRDRMGTAEKTPMDMINEASWFGLVTPQAVILLMLGAGVWVFSALKGYSGFDDPYPDYGKMDRAARDAREAVDDQRTEARATLEAPVEAAADTLRERLADMETRTRAGRDAYDAASARLQAIDSANSRAAETGAALIQFYRRENLAARNGTAAPAYFSETPPVQIAFSDALSRAADMRLEAERALAAAQRAVANEMEQLAAELEAHSAKLDGRE